MRIINLVDGRTVFPAVLALAALAVEPGFAHKVNIFAYAENQVVYTESYYSNGNRAVGCLVQVYGVSSGNLLLEGETDEQGKFSFKIPEASALKIVLSAADGHGNDYVLTEQDIEAALGLEMRDAPKGETALTGDKQAGWKTRPPVGEKTQADLNARPPVGEAEYLAGLVDAAVERRTGPLMRKLIAIEQRLEQPSLQDVLGGIGYIAGMMGVAIYMKQKCQRKKN